MSRTKIESLRHHSKAPRLITEALLFGGTVCRGGAWVGGAVGYLGIQNGFGKEYLMGIDIIIP